MTPTQRISLLVLVILACDARTTVVTADRQAARSTQTTTSAVSAPTAAAAVTDVPCSQGWRWTRLPTGQTGAVMNVWAEPDGILRAHFADGAAMHFDGARWLDTTLSKSWNALLGSPGSVLEPPFAALATHLLDSQASRVLAVGEGGRIALWNNGKWSLMDSGTRNDLRAIYVGAKANDWVVGGDDGTMLHYVCGGPDRGARPAQSCFSFADATVGKKLFAVSGQSRSNYYVAGAGGIWHVVDHKLTPLWTNRDARLEGLARIGTEVVAVGLDYSQHRALVIRCNGNDCSAERLPVEGTLKDVAVSTRDGGLVAVGHEAGAHTTGVVMRYDRKNQHWSRVGPSLPLLPEAVAVTAANEILVAGYDISDNTTGLAYRLKNKRWVKQIEQPNVPFWDLALHDKAMWVAGGKSNLRGNAKVGALLKSEGESWQPVQAGALAYRALALDGGTIVAAATRQMQSGQIQFELTAVNAANGDERTICRMPQSLQDVRLLDDGSIVAVGLDGRSLILSSGA